MAIATMSTVITVTLILLMTTIVNDSKRLFRLPVMRPQRTMASLAVLYCFFPRPCAQGNTLQTPGSVACLAARPTSTYMSVIPMSLTVACSIIPQLLPLNQSCRNPS